MYKIACVEIASVGIASVEIASERAPIKMYLAELYKGKPRAHVFNNLKYTCTLIYCRNLVKMAEFTK